MKHADKYLWDKVVAAWANHSIFTKAAVTNHSVREREGSNTYKTFYVTCNHEL